ncbi:hypothetical protein SDC9_158151 [bioreactor metagenome]|uniref:Uncharacterized protein n=1 Tax=bioreactor metagenome TaxID=1076179 RepID=A0A645FED2_9ZZZZ
MEPVGLLFPACLELKFPVGPVVEIPALVITVAPGDGWNIHRIYQLGSAEIGIAYDAAHGGGRLPVHLQRHVRRLFKLKLFHSLGTIRA